MTTQELLLSGLLTYLIHSTVLVACAWWATRWLHPDDLRLRRSLWRAALLGGLLTSGLQMSLRLEPLSGALRLGATTPGVPAATPTDRAHATRVLPPAALSAPTVDTRSTVVGGALGLWVVGVAFMGLRLGYSYLRFRRGLAQRQDASDDGLRARLRAVLAAGAVDFDVRLTCSDHLTVPIAFGVRRAEICVPSRIVEELDAEQQQALLAHELAHLVQRDPLWLGLYNAASILFFFQPLNWLARRRLLALSELAADGWAVETVADPLALAHCLTSVASWVRPTALPVLANAMAVRRSDLAQRIERVLSGSPARVGKRGALRPALWMLVVLGAVTFIAPGISLADKAVEPAPAASPEPAAVPKPARTWAAPRTAVRPAPPAPDTPPALDAPPTPAAPPARASKARPPMSPLPPPELATVDSDDAGPNDVYKVARQKMKAAAALVAAEDLKRQAELLKLASADQHQALKREAVAAAAQLKAQADEFRLSAENQAKVTGLERSALEDARRQLETAAKQLAQEREQLTEERHRLAEEAQRLQEERVRLRQEREKGRDPS